MKNVAAALFLVALSGTGAMAGPGSRDVRAARPSAPDLHRLDLRLTEQAPRAESPRWRLGELDEPVAEEDDSVVRWGWKKVTLKLPLGGTP
ncbi:hypothetical protein ACBY01_10310 [Sphingomonas sp. ac-8]|uniref:hypothetical protein n=1 Tax=Sphingomonas sp. ac-8 TaxID=3242977 RepID=UPI003A7FB5F8